MFYFKYHSDTISSLYFMAFGSVSVIPYAQEYYPHGIISLKKYYFSVILSYVEHSLSAVFTMQKSTFSTNPYL